MEPCFPEYLLRALSRERVPNGRERVRMPGSNPIPSIIMPKAATLPNWQNSGPYD